MQLIKLLKGVKYKEIKGNLNIEINSLCQNINKLTKDCLFFCYKGVSFDGHSIAYQVKNKGAIALVVEYFLDIDLPQILVKDTRSIMPKICNNFFNNVLQDLKFIGVTGTNGKTTISHIIYDILNLNGIKTGLIGTNGAKFSNLIVDTGFTTPDTVDLFYLLNKMKEKNIEYVVMEVSAHALYFNKIKGIKFEVGIFSNLSQDHLDFFKSMNKYALAKLKFFKKEFCKKCLINIDDEYGKLFYKVINCQKYSYSLLNPADFFAIDINLNINRSQFIANLLDEVVNVSSKFCCRFNVYNLLSALACCKLLNIDIKKMEGALSNVKQIEGRMNFYLLKNGVNVIIDYAHTPDSLEKVLNNLKELSVNSRIITVFGCGGNRDSSKRRIMGKIATQLSDFVVVTSDNPRNEKPLSIIKDIIQDVKTKNYIIEENREKAIKKAIEYSCVGDIILIAGKGAEEYQEVKGKKFLVSDKKIIANFVEK